MVMKTMNMMVEKDVKFMNVLDAKMINTQYGIETYLDLLKNVKVKDIQYVTETASYYEITTEDILSARIERSN
jgi:rubrerythrin